MKILIFIAIAAQQNQVPTDILVAMAQVESSMRPYATAFNDCGQGCHSHGLFQIQARTARHMGYTGPLKDLYNPLINADIAAKYLRYQYNRYGDWDKAVSAYNAGRYTIKNKQYVERVYGQCLQDC